MQTKQPSPAPFIIAVILGLGAGGLLLFPSAMLAMTALNSLINVSSPVWALVPCYIIAIALGTFGFRNTRRSIGFFSGLLIGCAAGMLGVTALCNVMIGSS